MQIPREITFSSLAEIINRVLLLVGLPLNTFDEGDITLSSDAGMVKSLLMSQSRELQTRGWWFNTLERYEVPPNTTTVSNPPPNVVSVSKSPKLPGDPEGGHYELWLNQFIAVSDADKLPTPTPPTDVTYLDLIIVISTDRCPNSFVDYLVYKTARIFGRSIGVKLDVYDEQQAFETLQLEHDRSSPKHNWFKESSSISRY